MYDVTIIGAGIVGAMIARTLSKYDLKICILEAENDVAMGATRANSAIVHAGFDAAEGTLKARLNVRGCALMPDICRELGVRYENNGSLVVAFSEEERATLRELFARGKANGVPDLRIVEREELLEMEPNLSQNVLCALYAPTAGIVCPYSLAIAAIGNAMDNAADLKCNFKVSAIRAGEGGYFVCSQEETVKTRIVINCAGLYADEIAKLIGDDSFAVHPRRGEYILLDKDCGHLFSRTIFRTPSALGKGILITPTVHGNLLLGPTSQNGTDKTDKDTTEEGLSKILQSTQECARSIPAQKTITSFCGLRPVGDTGDFIIRSPKAGFLHVAGIESPGLASSPAIAEYVEELLSDMIPLTPKADYNPIRESTLAFADASLAEKNRIIRENPAYGKIVCRCEGITEGEILEAIRKNPKARDLDGVKRRTRAQMGRCQGGFCGPAITELLARELKIDETSVTKFGGDSAVLAGTLKGGAQQ